MAAPLSVEEPPVHLIVIRLEEGSKNERPPDAGGLFVDQSEMRDP
jgi:hypothetical protein